MDYVIISGNPVLLEEAKVPVLIRGFMYGISLFETIPFYSGHFFRSANHLERLFSSARELMLEVNFNQDDLECWGNRLLQLNRISDGILRIMVYSVGQGRGAGVEQSEPCDVLLATYPANLDLRLTGEKSVSLYLSTIRRIPPSCGISRHKTGNYLNSILARREAEQASCDEALQVSEQGTILECAAANIFFCKNKTLFTPALDLGVLEGVTRQVVLELAKDMGFSVCQRAISLNEIGQFDSAFITNSVFGVSAVGKIWGKEGLLCDFSTGSKVQEGLICSYWLKVKSEAGRPWHW